MRIFDHLPAESKCPICGTNSGTPCVLVQIHGTLVGRTAQAQPFHVECIDLEWLKGVDTHFIAQSFKEA